MKPVALDIEFREVAPATALITLTGRLMLGPQGQELETLITELLEKGYRRFVFDMTSVTHIDSTGIGRCIACLNKIMPSGGQLHMAAPAGQVRTGFRVTHLDRVFRFFDTVSAAEAAF